MAFGWGWRSKRGGADSEANTAAIDAIRQVRDEGELFGALGEGTAIIYKHSSRCGICFRSMREIQRFAAQNPDVPVFMIEVVESRPLSDLVEQRLGVRHQSPQAIVVRAGKAVWDASHLMVTAGKMREAIA